LIEYRTFDGRMIPAWVYRPKGPGPHPVIVDIHGGPEGQERPGFSSTVQLWVNQLGAAVVAPNVRGSAGYGKEYLKLDNAMKREDSVKDIGALLDWIGVQPGLDGDRVAVYGGSYGGYMVLASMVHYSPRLRAGVDIVGISNFISFLENTQDYRRDLRRPEYGDERDPKMRAFFERIAPARNADRITAPLFVIQGQNDPRVPVTEAEQIVRVVRSNDRPVWYMNALNEGHGYRKQENRDLMNAAVVMFLREHLLGAQTRSAAAASR
jgi:dipeptidyl aminopeptidase/acylaminoacyl peptidase